MSDHRLPPSPARRRTRRSTLIVATVVASLLVGGVSIAIRSVLDDSAPRPPEASPEAGPVAELSAAATNVRTDLADRVGDSRFSFGDVVSLSIITTVEGQIELGIAVDDWTAPTIDDWQFGTTSVTWEVDTNGDGTADAQVRLAADENGPLAGVRDTNGRRRCVAEPMFDAASGSYGVRFEARCVGAPDTFRVRARFDYDDVVFELSDSDRVPDSGWSRSIAGPVVDSTRLEGSVTATERAQRCSIDC